MPLILHPIKALPHWLPVVLLLLGANCLKGQGLLLDDTSISSQPKWPDYQSGSKAELETLKGIYKIDLKPFCPEPQDQGFISSCTGWASGYGALTILHAIQSGWEGQRQLITENAFSALFIYNQIKKGSCDFGAYMSDAAILLRDKGNVTSKSFDKLKNKCDKLPTEQELREAYRFRIKDFMNVFSAADPESVKVQRTKLSLAQGKPVVIGMSLLKNFEGITGGYEYWYPQIGDTTVHGGHSLVVIGFDDGRESFEVMNSWGSQWGNDGFVWIKYRDYASFCHYGYIFIPQGDTTRFFDLTASMTIRSPFYPDPYTLEFKDESIRRVGEYYEIERPILNKTDVFQPMLKETLRDMYFYAFSIDAKNNIKVHWPRDGTLDNVYEGNHESAIITIPEIDLAVPGKYSGLSFHYSGFEYWCFLFSKEPLTHLNDHLKTLKATTGTDFYKRLKKVFGDNLLTSTRVRYAPDSIQAESDLIGEEIVPIILRFKVAG